jgi:hypothetical protein
MEILCLCVLKQNVINLCNRNLNLLISLRPLSTALKQVSGLVVYYCSLMAHVTCTLLVILQSQLFASSIHKQNVFSIQLYSSDCCHDSAFEVLTEFNTPANKLLKSVVRLYKYVLYILSCVIWELGGVKLNC